jgi:uncharacterized iron-regulated membrane protein
MSPALRTLHRGLGLTLGLFWLVQFLSGAILVFHRPLDDFLLGARSAAINFRKVDAALDRLSRQPGQGVVTSVTPSGGLDGQLDVLLRAPGGGLTAIRIDGSTGATLRTSSWDRPVMSLSPFRMVFLLHKQLLAGKLGEWVVGVSGLLLAVNILVGLRIAWPQPGRWTSVLLPRPTKSRAARLQALHRALGLVLAPLLLVTVISGLSMIWKAPLQAALGLRPFHAPVGERMGPLVAPVALSSAVSIGLRRLPNAMFAGVDTPGPGHAVYAVWLRQPGEWRQVFGSTIVYVDAADGRILAVRDARRFGLGESVIADSYPVHTWEWGGAASRWIAEMIGVAALVQAGLALVSSVDRRRLAARRRAN